MGCKDSSQFSRDDFVQSCGNWSSLHGHPRDYKAGSGLESRTFELGNMGSDEEAEPVMVSTSDAKLAEKESAPRATEQAARSVDPKALLAAASPYLNKV